VICAESPNAALELARTETFALFLIDNWMPGLSGTDLTERIRQFDLKTPIFSIRERLSRRTKKMPAAPARRDTWSNQQTVTS